jgi:hypothetical protein
MTITFTHKDNYGSALKGYVYKRHKQTMGVSKFLYCHWEDREEKIILADLCELLAEKGILNVDDIKRLARIHDSEQSSYEEQRDHRLKDQTLPTEGAAQDS